MWKAALSKGIKEVRFVLKQGPSDHGAWNYCLNRLPEIRMLNPNTYFSVSEINDNYQTPSALHLIYGDKDDTESEILVRGLTADDMEHQIKAAVEYGLSLRRPVPKDNTDRSIPVDVVEARNTLKKLDDEF